MNHNPPANADCTPKALTKLNNLIQRIRVSEFHCAITANTCNARHYLQALHDCGFVLDSEFRNYSNSINTASSNPTLALNKNKEITHAQ